MYRINKNIISLICGISCAIVPFIMPNTLKAEDQTKQNNKQVAARDESKLQRNQDRSGAGIGGKKAGIGHWDQGGGRHWDGSRRHSNYYDSDRGRRSNIYTENYFYSYPYGSARQDYYGNPYDSNYYDSNSMYNYDNGYYYQGY